MKKFAVFVLGIFLPLVALAQVGIPRYVQNLTVRGTLTVSTALSLPATSIADAALSANVPLLNTANDFSGSIQVPSSLHILGSSTGATNVSFMSLRDSADTERGYYGFGSGSNLDIYIANAESTGNIQLLTNSGSILGNSVDMTPSSGTFEITWEDACTTTPSQTWNYYAIGNSVSLRMVDSVSCTGDSTGMASTDADIPSALRPTATICSARIGTLDATANTMSNICIPSNGIVYATKCNLTDGKCGGSFTASGTRFLDATGNSGTTNISYILN